MHTHPFSSRTKKLALSALLLAASPLAAKPQLLQNSDFEDGLTPWRLTPNHAHHQTGSGREGSNALQLTATTERPSPYVTYQIVDLRPDAVYQFSAWARVAPGSPAVDGAIKIEYYSDTNKNTTGLYSRLRLPANGEWKYITLTVPADADTVRADLLLRMYGEGSVIFDDASFVMTKSPPDVSVVEPRRHFLNLTKPQEAAYRVRLNRSWTVRDKPNFIATLAPLDAYGKPQKDKGRALQPTVRQLDLNSFEVKVQLPAAEGVYALDFSYSDGGKTFATEKPAYVFPSPPHQNHDRFKPQHLTENGTILHNGQPFFPLGMYHPAHTAAGYKQLSEAGFNAIQGSATNNIDSLKASLDRAQQHGLAVDVPLYMDMKVAGNLDATREKVKALAGHPAILNWKIIDEPDYHPNITHEVPGSYYAIKELDNKNPVELTLHQEDTLGYWAHFSDIVQVDHYPIPGKPLTGVASYTRTAKAAAKPWQNISFVLQSGWTPDMKTQPTPAQARSMVYLALIEGAKGIWWYSMYDPGWDLSKTPLWPHLKTINAEIKSLSEPLMFGKVVPGVTVSNDKLHFQAFAYAGQTYLLVTNPHEEAAQGTFTLPQGFRTWRTLSGEEVTPITGNQLAVSFAGIDSQTYVLE